MQTKKLKLKRMVLVILSLTLFCQTSLGQTPKRLNDFSCLSREQKEQIAVCLKENLACHAALNEKKSDAPEWTAFAGVVLLSIISGMAIEHQLK